MKYAIFLRRIESRPPIPDMTVTRRVAVKNRRKVAIICTISFVTQRISLVSQIGKTGHYSTQKTTYFVRRSICGAGKITVNLA